MIIWMKLIDKKESAKEAKEALSTRLIVMLWIFELVKWINTEIYDCWPSIIPCVEIVTGSKGWKPIMFYYYFGYLKNAIL